ncbi:hypothetical protein, partial [Bilophila wadsworthia]|uniref:hypothetical protein n=1 Tax=Bilophila wadsworthia TaxID=35833 RepID=UPI00267663F7
KPGMYTAPASGSTNAPFIGPFAEIILGSSQYRSSLLLANGRSTRPRAAISSVYTGEGGGFTGYNLLITAQQIGDGLQISSDGTVSVERRVEIPSGTRMLFQQTNAPTGWTKITAAEYNNAALRLVTGNVTNYTAGLAFSTAFASGRATTATAGGGSVGATTLTVAQMPKHKHSVTHYVRRESGGDFSSLLYAGTGPNRGTMTCAEAGGSSAHTHSFSGISHSHALNLNVKYIDFIVAQKA